MGTFTEKIAELKNKMNSTYSAYVSTLTDTYNGDYCSAIVSAVRTMGKHARVNIKTIWIPILAGQRYFGIAPSLYTKDKIEYVKPCELTLISVTGSGATAGVTVAKGDKTTIEAVERNDYIDWSKFAQVFRQGTVGIKSSSVPTGSTFGATALKLVKILTVTSPKTFTPTGAPTVPIVAGDIVVNLDKVDNLTYCYDVIASSAANTPWSTVLTADTTSGRFYTGAFWAWEVGDILCITTGNPAFLSFTFEAIPKFGYLTAVGDLANDVPVLPQFYDDIDDLAMKYLYQILALRDPEKMNIYVGLVKSGLIKSEPEVIRDVKMRAQTMDLVTTESYQPYSQQYGR